METGSRFRAVGMVDKNTRSKRRVAGKCGRKEWRENVAGKSGGKEWRERVANDGYIFPKRKEIYSILTFEKKKQRLPCMQQTRYKCISYIRTTVFWMRYTHAEG